MEIHYLLKGEGKKDILCKIEKRGKTQIVLIEMKRKVALQIKVLRRLEETLFRVVTAFSHC